MIFAEMPLSEAEGAILAHSLRIGDKLYKKGVRLDAACLDAMRAAGVERVVAARLEADDAGEDEAAERVAAALVPDPGAARVTVSAPFAGRVNLYAAEGGLFEIDPGLVAALNAIDESVTLATLTTPCWAPARRMLATVKIIPYAAPESAVAAAERLARNANGRPRVLPARRPTTTLILTETPGLSRKVLDKGGKAIEARLSALGAPLIATQISPHRVDALAAMLGRAEGSLVLVLAASATSDRRDVTPAAIEAAGGVVDRLGMPVDPGNLLVLGRLGEKAVVGLPGCARSPKLNGADWVLERLAAGRPPTSDDLARMGFGGLLKEIASRPAPRVGVGEGHPGRPRVAAVLLAAGGSSRMGPGRHKLLEVIDGAPLVRRSAQTLLDAGIDDLLVVVGSESERIAAALDGLPTRRIENAAWSSGMASSLRAGALAISPEADAALIALADMPDVEAGLIRRLIAAFDAEEGREIVRPLGRDGRPGHPILFGRRFFESLAGLTGDEGARRVIAEHPDYVTEVEIGGDGPLLDLDTPEDWSAYHRARAR